MGQLENPYARIPFKEAAWADGFTKGLASVASPSPSEDVSPDDYAAFNEGVSYGSMARFDGIEFPSPCFSALETAHHETMAFTGVEVLHSLWEMRHLKTVGLGVAGLVVAVIELAITLPVHTLPPDEVLPNTTQRLLDRLSELGLSSMEFYVGVGLDAGSRDCEIRVTPMFVDRTKACDAAKALGRQEWIVVSWRTDQSNSFRVVDSC